VHFSLTEIWVHLALQRRYVRTSHEGFKGTIKPRANRELLAHCALAIALSQLSPSSPLAVDATSAMASAENFVWHNAPLASKVLSYTTSHRAISSTTRAFLGAPTVVHVSAMRCQSPAGVS